VKNVFTLVKMSPSHHQTSQFLKTRCTYTRQQYT